MPGKLPTGRDVARETKKLKFLEHLREGWTATKAAALAGVDRVTVYGWRSDDEIFAKDWNDAVEAGVDCLEDEAMRRAVKGVEEPVFGKEDIKGYVTKYSDPLLIFLMKGRRRKVYGEAKTVELTGPGGKPLQSMSEVTNLAPGDASRLYQDFMKEDGEE